MINNIPDKHISYSYNNNRIQLQILVKQLFEEFLDVVEESDSGREFHPTTISTVRCLQIEPLNVLLKQMRELSGVSNENIIVLK